MAGAKEVTVRTQRIDGSWDTLGNSRARGIWPEGVTLEADGWGPSKASFSLRRDPTAFWPDIGAFTPVEIDVGSTLVWSGRVSETPARVAQRVMNVQCEGWQYHLDDDLYQRAYVHSQLSAWADVRSNINASLGATAAAASATVSTDGGLLLSLPKGMTVSTGTYVGVYLDLGAVGGTSGDGLANRISVDYRTSAHSGFSLHVRTLDGVSGSDLTAGNDAATLNGIDLSVLGASGSRTGGFSVPKRYVLIYLQTEASAVGVNGADVWVQLTGVRVYTNDAYESGGQSALRANHVISDALSRATVLLSSDTSGISSTSFSIPSYAPDGPQTPRQAWLAVDAFHDWHKQIDVQRRPVYQPRPSRPLFEVGAWSAIDDDDASANSGSEIYNRALVTGTAADGSVLLKERTQGAQTGAASYTVSSPAPVNPSFATNASGWTATNSVITRTTTDFDTSPAAGLWDRDGSGLPLLGGASLSGSFSGTFRAGVTYILTLKLKTTDVAVNTLDIRFGTTTDFAWTNEVLSTAFVGFTVVWTPAATSSGATLSLLPSVGRGPFLIDSLRLDVAMPTLVDRRGFRRSMTLPVNASLPSDGVAAGQIADTWLGGHKTTPFKGSVTLTGDSSLRNVLTGHNVPLETLLLNTGQLLRFSDRSDPDTGGHGRDGRIASVTYTPATDTAQVTIDNSRSSFDALLSRLSVIQGS